MLYIFLFNNWRLVSYISSTSIEDNVCLSSRNFLYDGTNSLVTRNFLEDGEMLSSKYWDFKKPQH